MSEEQNTELIKISNYGMNMNGYGGYNNILESAINAALVTVMSGKKLALDRKTILYIIMFSSIGEVKNFSKWILKNIQENGFSYLKKFFNYLKNERNTNLIKDIALRIKLYISNKFSNNNSETKLEKKSQKKAEKTVLKVGTNFQVIDAILTYINTNPLKGSYDYKIMRTNTKNLHERVDKVMIYNIHLSINNFEVFFKDDLFVEYMYSTNEEKHEVKLEKIIGVMTTAYFELNDTVIIEPYIQEYEVGKIKSLEVLIDNSDVVNILNENTNIFDAIAKILVSNNSFILLNNYGEVTQNDKNVSYQNIIKSIKEVYNEQYNLQKEYYYMAELLILLHYSDYQVRFTRNKIHFDCFNTSIVFTNENYDMTGCKISDDLEDSLSGLMAKIIDQYNDVFENEFALIKNNKTQFRKDLDVNLNLELTSKENVCYKFVDEWNDYLYNTIIKSYLNKKLTIQNVTVYTLKIGENIEEETIPNPEYEIYMQKKEMFNSLTVKKNKPTYLGNTSKGENKEDILSVDQDVNPFQGDILIGMGLHNIPPQTIVKKTVEKIVECQTEGTVKKHLDTLYLRKNDITRLKNILKNFTEYSNIYEDLCITKKLGIMLHGVPGSGKSSTIIAIATFLNYDIYYISLNGITKNSELKMIFDHVSKNCSKKGIIVFEDIDAQTDIVHKRNIIVKDQIKTETFDETKLTVHDINNKKNDDLDLSFLLNILDGTLSQQDMVYIITTNHLERLDPALYRRGRINVVIHLKPCDRYQIECIFEKIMKRSLDKTILNNISEDVYTPAEVIHHFLENIHNFGMSDDEILNGLKEYHVDFNPSAHTMKFNKINIQDEEETDNDT